MNLDKAVDDSNYYFEEDRHKSVAGYIIKFGSL